MSLPDVINGLYEAFGGLVILLNVLRIRKDKQVRGVNALTTVFFTTWGFWNLYYYPHLNQWFSFAGGVFIVFSNTLWLYYAYKYRNN